MILQPLDDKVVIRPDKHLERHGSILLPENMEYRPRFGEVLAVGPGRWHFDNDTDTLRRVPMAVKAGDRVAFSHYGTDGIEIEREEYLVIPESRVLGIVPPGEMGENLLEPGPMKANRKPGQR
jgi:chaperonin GroES